jgi:hypothetical protein
MEFDSTIVQKDVKPEDEESKGYFEEGGEKLEGDSTQIQEQIEPAAD